VNLLEIPGYREAVEKERADRDASFIDAPEVLGGFSIAPLTLRRFLVLQAINHPFIRGVIPSPMELVAFLWYMNPEYKIGGRKPRSFANAASGLIPPSRRSSDGFWGRVRKRKEDRVLARVALLIAQIRNWLDDIFRESGGGPHVKGYVKEYWSFGIHVIFQLAQETGWSEQAILDIPLKRLFQYRKFLRKTLNPKAPLFNPSDRILGDWMKEQNKN
jgi:hypothetical protein